MANTRTDYTNPRDVIAQIYKILFTQSGWDEAQKKSFQRWKKRTKLGETDNDWFQKIFSEILAGIANEFPVQTTDGVNFIAKEADLYSGQLFSFTIPYNLWYVVKPFFVKWIEEYHKVNSNKEELAITTLMSLLYNWKEFDDSLGVESMSHEKKLSQLFGKYWYLPSYSSLEDGHRIILPVEKLLIHITDVIEANSVHELIDRISEIDKDRSTVKKAIYKLNKGKPISIEQLRKLSKLQMGKYLEMDQSFKDSANGFYIIALLVSSVVSDAISELSLHDSNFKHQLCRHSVG